MTGQSRAGRSLWEEVGSAATGRAASRRRSCSRCAARVEAAATAAAPIRVMPTPAAVLQGEREMPGTGSEGPSPSQTVIAIWSADSPPRRALVLSRRTAAGARGWRSPRDSPALLTTALTSGDEMALIWSSVAMPRQDTVRA